MTKWRPIHIAIFTGVFGLLWAIAGVGMIRDPLTGHITFLRKTPFSKESNSSASDY
jgi:predicted anti-sigma-YlaC factor YlaD